MAAPAIRAPSVQVPGLLGDDALQEQLKALAQQQTSDARAVAPTSAVEMSQKIAQDFVVDPIKRTASDMPRPAAAPVTPPTAALEQPSMSSVLGRAALDFVSPLGGMLAEGGVLGRLGALTPEDAAAEQEQRVEAAAQEEQALKAAEGARQTLRDMTDEQAASMGLPVAPGVFDAETVRELDAQNERRRAFAAGRAEEAAADTQMQRENAPTQTWWLNAARSAYKGTTGIASSAARGAVIPFEFTIGDGERSEVRAWVDKVDAAIEQMIPGDKAKSKDFLTKLSAGGGSMLGFMIGGMVSSSIGLPATVGTLIMGALTGGAEQYTDAERFGASGVQKLISYFLGMGIGATEAIPVNNALMRLETGTGGVVSRMLQNTAASSMEEFVQELGQSIGSDLVAQTIYDENREIDWGEAFESAAIGGILGAMMGGSVSTLQEVGVLAGDPTAPVEAEAVQVDDAAREVAVEEFLTAEQATFDSYVVDFAKEVDAAELVMPELAAAVAPDQAVAVEPEAATPSPVEVAEALVARAATEVRPSTVVAEEFVAALPRAPLFEFETAQARGGTVPAPGSGGKVTLRHYAAEPRAVLDPEFQGTGPLRGEERARLAGGAAPRVYYGVNTGADFRPAAQPREQFAKLNADERAAARRLVNEGMLLNEGQVRVALEARWSREMRRSGYQRETGLGDIEHEVKVDPDDLYNMAEDPLGLRTQLDPNLTPAERTTQYEQLVRDAGFRGAFFPESALGQTAILFEAAEPTSVIDTVYGVPPEDIARIEDFANLTAETFNKGGWAIVTGTREALGPATAPENVAANERMRKRLERDKVPYIEVSGAYMGEAQGEVFLIFAPPEYARKLGRSYKQESILTRRGLEYTDGSDRLVPHVPAQTVVGDAARELDFYSTMPDGTSFSMGLDFDALVDPAAEAATAVTGDQWTPQELAQTLTGWAEALSNPESTHPLAAEIRELAENAGDLDANQLAEVIAGQLAAGRAAATGEGTAAAQRAGDGPWVLAALREQDAEPASGAQGGGPEFLASVAPVRSGALPLFPDLREQSFDRWFGDSEVVDGDGKPLVVFHGTPSPGFNAFDPNKTGTTSVLFSSIETHRQGFFFSESRDFAQSFAEQRRGGDVMPVFLSVQNAFDAREFSRNTRLRAEEIARRIEEIDPEYDTRFFMDRVGDDSFWEVLDTPEGGDVVVQAMKDLGYDGIRLIEPNHDTRESETVWVAFDPTQIKSAVTNTGAYSPSNPDIFAATAQNRGSYRGEPQRPARGVPGAPGAANAEVRLAKIADNFTKLLDLTIRQGRFTLRGGNVMGQYSSRQDVVRLRTPNDLSTLIHEGGHALQARATGPLKTFINGHIDELQKVAKALYGGDLSKADNATKTAEGFAEFFRVYVTNRAFAERKYPKLSSDFAAVLDGDPRLRDGLKSIGDQFAAWLQLPSAQLLRNMVVSGERVGAVNEAMAEIEEQGFGTWMHEVARNALAQTVNQNAALNDLVSGVLNVAQDSGRVLDLKAAEDPRVLIRLVANSGGRAMVQVTDGVMGHRSTVPTSRSLRDVLLKYHGLEADQNLSQIDPERQADFAAYLIALRGIDEYRRFSEGKIERPPVAATLGDLKVTVRELNAKYGSDFAEAAQMVHEYGMALWQKAFDAGLMSKDTYKDGLDRQFYAPLQRDMSDRGPSMSDIAGTTAARPVKRFRGSDRNIIDPMDALMAKTFALERVIAENEVKKSLASLADKVGQVGALVERVPAQQMLGQEYSVQEVARQLTKDDTLTEADAQDLMTLLEASIEEGNRVALFRSQQALARGENIVFFWENGKLAALQIKDGPVGADVVNTLNAVGVENMPLLVDTLAHTSTAFRSAITSWPDFLVVNFIRDQVSAWLLTDVGYKPFVSGFGGMASEVRQKTWARQYNAAMGIMGGMNTAALHKARVDRDISSLRNRGYLVQAFGEQGLGGAIKGIARITELSETGTRLGIFKNAYERAKADGLTDWEASIEASYIATDYIDFGLHGNRMLAHRRLIPFLNAQLQGLYKMMRTLGGDEVRQRRGLMFALTSFFKDINGLELSRREKAAIRTGRKAWLKMMSLGLIGALLHFIFEDDPDYQDTSEYLRATGWVIPLGEGRIAYVPKPFELAIVSNFVERALEHASGDGEAKARFLRGAMLNLTPPTSPPAVQVLVEQLANYDFFSDRDIVPDYMQALAPELQYSHFTSAFAKEVGSLMGWSPLRIDHAMSGMFASAYRDAIQAYNSTDPNRPNSDATEWPLTRRFVRDARRGATSSQDFWTYASTVSGTLRRAETTYRRYLDEGREQTANAYLDTLDEDHKSYALLNAHFKAEAKRLNPMYRARQITTIVSGMRRELPTELGLEDTGLAGGEIVLSSKEKAEVDEVLSEIARREVRNTLVASKAPGWANKKPLPVGPTLELLRAVHPLVAEEYERRYKKAKIYDSDLVQEYWPEVKDRLIQDREAAFLDDIVTIAKAMQ